MSQSRSSGADQQSMPQARGTTDEEPRPASRRLKPSSIIGAVVVVILTACSGTSEVALKDALPSPPSTESVEIVEQNAPSPTNLTTTTPPTSPNPAPSFPNRSTTTAPPPAPAPQISAAGFAVRSVTDGDTLTLADGRRVRLAQVDAPETGDCFGAESTAALRALVQDKTVTLRRPSNGPEKDRYGRTVAEVSVADRSVNEQLVRDGAAEWYDEFAREDIDLAGRLRSAESDAQTSGRGLWAACGSAAPAPTASPPTAQAGATAGGNCHPAYPDDCIPPAPPDLDCPDIKRKVRVDHAHGDPHGFDADRDGWGCQSYG